MFGEYGQTRQNFVLLLPFNHGLAFTSPDATVCKRSRAASFKSHEVVENMYLPPVPVVDGRDSALYLEALHCDRGMTADG